MLGLPSILPEVWGCYVMDLKAMKRRIYDGIFAYLVEGGFESSFQREIQDRGTDAEKARLERALRMVIDETGWKGT